MTVVGTGREVSSLYSAQATDTQDCDGVSTAKQPHVSGEAGKLDYLVNFPDFKGINY